ncbi:MAG: hypothetical protein J6A75_02650 [Lachnospiraceae bacterium]|nr:hypothetical protein [Lachnospiraceae bacterium]
MYMQSDWDMNDGILHILKKIKNDEEIRCQNKDELIPVMKCIKKMCDIAKEEGLLVLEDSIEDILASNAPYVDFLPDKILLMVDGTDEKLLLEVMLNDILSRNAKGIELVALYAYMLGIYFIGEQFLLEIGIRREEAKEALEKIREYAKVLPGGEIMQ